MILCRVSPRSTCCWWQVEAPVFSPDTEGPFKDNVDVVISTETEGAAIHYTTNGAEPTESSRLYNPAQPVVIDSINKVVRARAYAPHMAPSDVSHSVEFVVEASDPTFAPGLLSPHIPSALTRLCLCRALFVSCVEGECAAATLSSCVHVLPCCLLVA